MYPYINLVAASLAAFLAFAAAFAAASFALLAAFAAALAEVFEAAAAFAFVCFFVAYSATLFLSFEAVSSSRWVRFSFSRYFWYCPFSPLLIADIISAAILTFRALLSSLIAVLFSAVW